MTVTTIESAFQQRVAGEVRLLQEAPDRYRVFVPFRFEDGDHFTIVLRKMEGSWALSDEGHTLMRLTYDVAEADLREGHRKEIISDALKSFATEDRDGELIRRVDGDDFGTAFFDFTQALVKIADVTYLSRERVASTFREDLESLIIRAVPRENVDFDWVDPLRDPEHKYVVHFRIEQGLKPIFVFALRNDENVRDATITLHQFAQWGVVFRSAGVFDRQERIGRKVLARFTDVCDHQFPSLEHARESIEFSLLKP